MAKKGGLLSTFVSLTVWLTGIIVSLAVGFGLKDSILVVPYLSVVNVIAGWVVIVLTLVSVILAIIHKLR